MSPILPSSLNHDSTATSPNPTPSLLALPKELLALIASHLPLPSAIALRLSHSSLKQPAESRIWRDLNLTIPKYYGESVLIAPHAHGTSAHCSWAESLAYEVEMAGRAETRRKVENIILVMDDERRKCVRKVVIEPRPGANNAIVQVSSFVKDHVREMELMPLRDHIFRDQWQPTRSEMLWHKLLDFGLQNDCFRNLETVTIEYSVTDHADNLISLLRLSPNIRVLHITAAGDIDYHPSHCDCGSQHLADEYRSLDELPLLEQLSITSKGPADGGLQEWISDLLQAAGNLRSFTLHLPAAYGYPPIDVWLEALNDSSELTRLDWRCGAGFQLDEFQLVSLNLSSLEQLIVDDFRIDSAAKERIEFVSFPIKCQSLKSIVIETQINTVPSSPKDKAFTPFQNGSVDVDPIFESVLSSLSTLPKLEVIQFVNRDTLGALLPAEQWEAAGIHGIVIRQISPSFEPYKGTDIPYHGETESSQRLWHIQTYTTSTKQGAPCRSHSASDRAIYESPIWVMGDRTNPRKCYYCADEGGVAHWEDATHFDGAMVPLWVIAKMKEEDLKDKEEKGKGKGKEEEQSEEGGWDSSRVKVRRAGWKVLTDWREELRETQKGKKGKEKEKAKAKAKAKGVKQETPANEGGVHPVGALIGMAMGSI